MYAQVIRWYEHTQLQLMEFNKRVYDEWEMRALVCPKQNANRDRQPVYTGVCVCVCVSVFCFAHILTRCVVHSRGGLSSS